MEVAYNRFDNVDMDRTKLSGNYMVPVFENMMRSYSFARVADIGCGNGFFTSWFVQQNRPQAIQLDGFDGSTYGVEQAKASGFREVYLVNDLSSDALPAQKDFYDLVICKDLLEHLLNPMQVVLEAKRILKPGGVLFVLVPNHFPLWHRLKFLFHGRIDTQEFFPESHEWDFPHIRFFTDQGLRKMMTDAGLKWDRTYSGFFPSMPGTGKVPGLLGLAHRLAQKYPNQFSSAHALAFRK